MTRHSKKRPALIAGVCLSLILVSLIAALIFIGPVPARAERSESSETTIRATVVAIELPDPQQEPIDASEDSLEPRLCWVVRVDVNSCLPGGFAFEDQTLNLLVHSPSLSLGAGKKGDVIDIRLERSTKPVEFLVAQGGSRGLSQLPDTQHRRFRILTQTGVRIH